jgi:hypothetical protein
LLFQEAAAELGAAVVGAAVDATGADGLLAQRSPAGGYLGSVGGVAVAGGAALFQRPTSLCEIGWLRR